MQTLAPGSRSARCCLGGRHRARRLLVIWRLLEAWQLYSPRTARSRVKPVGKLSRPCIYGAIALSAFQVARHGGGGQGGGKGGGGGSSTDG